jgi:peroxin-2
MKSGGDNELEEKSGELSFLPERTCAICYHDQNSNLTSENDILAASGGVIGSAQTDITNPYEAIPCGCIYCFVCLASRLEAEEGEGWVCLRCAEIVKECKPWSGDVVEEVIKSTSNLKSVGFSDDHETNDEDTVAQLAKPPAVEVESDEDNVAGESDEQSEAYEEDEAGDFDDN